MAYVKFDGRQAASTAASTTVSGADGAQVLTGGNGADAFWGSQGDVLRGGLGDDTYYLTGRGIVVTELANAGIDLLVGWQNLSLSDYVNIENLKVSGAGLFAAGNGGDNIIEGGEGGQQIYGGGGQDVLIGGAGGDTFIVYKGEGSDVIQDFNVAEDVIRLKAGFTSFSQVASHLVQQGADVRVDLGDGDGLMLRNVVASQLSAKNFALQMNYGALGAATFADEFNGPLSLWDAQSNPSGTWRPDYGYQGSQGYGSYTLANNGEQQIYTSPFYRDHAGDFAETPFVANGDGTVSIWAKSSANSELFGFKYTSGLITTQPTFSQTYGYFEMRADIPEVAGTWPAFWLLPADGSWPPELDVMETLGGDPRASWTTEHSAATGIHTSNGAAQFVPDTIGGMHTYGVLWTAEDLVWYIDGVEVFRAATPDDMHKPMYMLANLAVGGWAGAASANLAAEFKIDYIRAYAVGDTVSEPVVTPPPVAEPTPGASDALQTADASFTLAPDAHNLKLVGSAAQAGFGNSLDNVLTANDFASKLSGGAGADTLIAGRGAVTLTGGDGADVFVFTALPWNAGHITDFKVGVDKLDLSALVAASGYAGQNLVKDGYLSFASDGAGGTRVFFDPDGRAGGNPWPFLVTTLDGVSPGSLNMTAVAGGGAQPTPPTPAPGTGTIGAVLTAANDLGSALVGTAGADTFNASRGADILTGGGGHDTFTFASLPWNAGHITDFMVGEDHLNLKALFTAAGYGGIDPIADGVLSFRSDGKGSTQVYFDPDGRAAGNPWPFLITTLDHVAPSTLSAANWDFD